MTDPLDNPVWSALTTGHASLAQGNGLARRYPSDVSPLIGMREPTAAAFANLRELATPGQPVATFTAQALRLPAGWEVVRTVMLDQMLCQEPAGEANPPLTQLTQADVPDMLALTALTEPGPFLPQTIRMGRYIGIRAGKALLAMAGERLNLDSHIEVSAVCTHPGHRGSGHGGAVVLDVTRNIIRAGKIPVLHVLPENPAKHLYEKLGFRTIRQLHLTAFLRV